MSGSARAFCGAGDTTRGLCRLLPSVLRQTVWRGNTVNRSVALTFDDGPHPIYTAQVLDILRRHHTPATFFLLGRHVEQHPHLVRQIFANAHTVGNHSYGHRHLILAPQKLIRQEMVETSAAIERITGQKPRFFRPPRGLAGWKALSLASQLGMRTVLWSLSTGDWKQPGTDHIVRRVLDRVRNGTIVLLHDAKYDDPGEDRSQTVRALPEIIRGLKSRGYRLVTLPELILPQQAQEKKEPAL